MKHTVTYERLMALLLVSGAPVDRVEQLANRALGIAYDRHSSVVGGRHLLMAAGVWERPGTPVRVDAIAERGGHRSATAAETGAGVEG